MLTEINVTPLVDVMLVLLIIFMVTGADVANGRRREPAAGQGADHPRRRGEADPHRHQGQARFLGKLQIPWDDVEKTLKNNAKLNADHELYLHADKDLPYGEVVKVMAAVKQAGVDKLGMVTDPLE
jgi:biopolymer transport protein TolR